MKNTQKIKKAIALVLSALMLAGALALPTSALEYKNANNAPSKAYSSSEYYKKLISLSLTGDGRTDLLAVALSQLGYTEGNVDGAFGGNENGTDNFTEYNYNMGSFGVGYGGIDYPWCASFVAFCLLQSDNHNQQKIADWCRKNEGDANYVWREVSCNRWAKQLRACGYFEDSVRFGGDYLPIPGDLIYFTEDGKLESHIGIVLYCDGERVYTVEGNTSSATGLETNGGGVYTKSYPISSAYIRGYGVLPYKVDNSVPRIDYSGTAPTRGIYISTTEKFIYSNADTSEYTHLLPKNSFFEVTEVVDNSKLKIRCQIDGATVEGYVKNNSDRVIQLSSSEAQSGYTPIENAWGYKRSSIDAYHYGTRKDYTKQADPTVTLSEGVGISGSASFSREIKRFGYYFDGNYTKINYIDGAIVEGESIDVTYKIIADTASLAAGKHTVTFVTELSDKAIVEIDTFSFTAKAENTSKPEPPTLEGFTDTSIALAAVSGYEYKLGDSQWQSSATFFGLSEDAAEPYLFYTRIAESENMMPSEESEPLSIDLRELVEATRLSSLSISGATLSPEFDPKVTEYTASLRGEARELVPEASARDGSTVTTEDTFDDNGIQTEIKITVTSPYGVSRIYSIKPVFEPELTTETVTDAPETEESAMSEVIILPEPSGCAGAVSFSGAAIVAALLTCAAFVTKKKE